MGAAATHARHHDLAAATQSTSVRRPAPRWRPGGAGPLYWSTYGYENTNNKIIPESVWKSNVDWVAANFRDYGYKMVCTDGWIDNTQKITPNGYILSQADDWEAHLGLVGEVHEGQGPRGTRRLLQPVVGDEVRRSRTPKITVVGRPWTSRSAATS